MFENEIAEAKMALEDAIRNGRAEMEHLVDSTMEKLDARIPTWLDRIDATVARIDGKDLRAIPAAGGVVLTALAAKKITEFLEMAAAANGHRDNVLAIRECAETLLDFMKSPVAVIDDTTS